jgi:molybdopterin biosynthesis enzyme
MNAVLGESVRGRKDWTQFIFGTISRYGKGAVFYPLKTASRLEMMARAEGIMSIPKGKEYLMEGEGVNVQLPAVIKI